jgi:hypothetical protein
MTVGISVGGKTGTGVAVLAAGFGRSMYAQRFSCVGVGEAKMAALTGDVAKEINATSPTHTSTGISHKAGIRQERLLEEDEFMELN